MPHSDVRDSIVEPAEGGKNPPDKQPLDLVQRQTFRYFWELLTRSVGWRAPRQRLADLIDDAVAISGSDSGVVAILRLPGRSRAIPAMAANLKRS